MRIIQANFQNYRRKGCKEWNEKNIEILMKNAGDIVSISEIWKGQIKIIQDFVKNEYIVYSADCLKEVRTQLTTILIIKKHIVEKYKLKQTSPFLNKTPLQYRTITLKGEGIEISSTYFPPGKPNQRNKQYAITELIKYFDENKKVGNSVYVMGDLNIITPNYFDCYKNSFTSEEERIRLREKWCKLINENSAWEVAKKKEGDISTYRKNRVDYVLTTEIEEIKISNEKNLINSDHTVLIVDKILGTKNEELV